MRQRRNIQVDHRELFGGIAVGKFAELAESGVVHQDFYENVFGLQFLKNARRRCGVGQIGGEYSRADFVFRFQFFCEYSQRVFIARHQNNVAPAARQQPRNFQSDAARCARDERRATILFAHFLAA